jgi:hypothetical protein
MSFGARSPLYSVGGDLEQVFAELNTRDPGGLGDRLLRHPVGASASVIGSYLQHR